MRKSLPRLFLDLLIEATARLPGHCFQLPVPGGAGEIYRERVYCYELYHQLQNLLDGERRLAGYTLSGEVDKGGHPIIRRCAPDLLFHVPGEMNRNLVVVEVKAASADARGIKKDLATLEYFVSERVGYELGILLVYGDDEKAFSRFEREFRSPGPKKLLLWHRHPGERAIRKRIGRTRPRS